MGALRLSDLQRPGLEPVSLTVAPAQTLCIHGHSGSGKTLLLRAIADLDPNRGQVFLGEVERTTIPAHRWRQQVMYLPPESHWWADRVGPHAAHWPLPLLQALGFDQDVLDWELARLSSGERQRLSLARVLAREPLALLLDEPTANLDPANTLTLEGLIADYQQQRSAPVIWVSHDAAQRSRVATREYIIDSGRLQ